MFIGNTSDGTVCKINGGQHLAGLNMPKCRFTTQRLDLFGCASLDHL